MFLEFIFSEILDVVLFKAHAQAIQAVAVHAMPEPLTSVSRTSSWGVSESSSFFSSVCDSSESVEFTTIFPSL